LSQNIPLMPCLPCLAFTRGRYDAALRLAKEGFTVYAGVRKSEDADRLASLGVQGLVPLMLDVASEESVEG
jgi:NAD(P)-dependent dehydrogenase (short-subunit alcohol dehydrogenase family)